MKPELEIFEEAVRKYRGNLTKIAVAFGVTRRTVHAWAKEPTYAAVIADERKRLFDDTLTVAEVVALGIPKKDENNRIIGWEERPDSGLLKFILSTLGRDEGFGERLEIANTGAPTIGIMLPDNKRGRVVEFESLTATEEVANSDKND